MKAAFFLKNKVFITAVFGLLAFFSLNNADAQQQYNLNALEQLKRSVSFLMSGEYSNAIESCNQLIRLDPNSTVNYILRARAYYEIGEYDLAINDCNQVTRLDRNNTAAYNIRANCYRQKGELSKAINEWQIVLRINPNLEEARINLEIARSSQEN
ncbi:MAG: tetratricopeptide repeat protein [Treponema sp.]|nr:tetratricopeptide repeat protein [Treponema sp.]MCL2251500.1 tetratricopeptide repeat protein [Treponema sp.]